MTFSVLTCTVAVGDAAQNHSDSAQNVCRKKAAQISLVEVLQLEDILCICLQDWKPSQSCFFMIFELILILLSVCNVKAKAWLSLFLSPSLFSPSFTQEILNSFFYTNHRSIVFFQIPQCSQTLSEIFSKFLCTSRKKF